MTLLKPICMVGFMERRSKNKVKGEKKMDAKEARRVTEEAQHKKIEERRNEVIRFVEDVLSQDIEKAAEEGRDGLSLFGYELPDRYDLWQYLKKLGYHVLPQRCEISW